MQSDHVWFSEQLATHLAGGLEGDERSRFESHAASCVKCAAELERARRDEQRLSELFADSTPQAGFEDRIISRLRTSPSRRMWIHPLIVRVAATAAAAAVVGGVGYVASDAVRRDAVSATVATNLRQIGQAILIYSNDSKGLLVRSPRPDRHVSSSDDITQFQVPSSNAENWDFGAGSNTSLNWSDWNGTAGVQRSLSYSYANPYPARGAPTVDQIVSNGFVSRGKSNNHDEDAQNELYGDGHYEFQRNAFPEDKSEIAPLGPQMKEAADASAPRGERTQPDDQQFKLGMKRDNIYPARTAMTRLGASEDVRVLNEGVVLGKPFKPGEFGLDAPKLDNVQVADKLQLAQVGTAKSEAGGGVAAGQAVNQALEQPPPATTFVVQRKVIRNGQLEFEVDSFDSAVATITKVVAEETGFIATTNSAKLDNGKVKGTIVVRVPPDHLDTLVLKLRALGELKRQNLSAQDVTKLYTDLESELRAARAMEERLIEIIKTGKGEIKDLLAAEKELANWRGKIEKILGEINYYNNQVALSTLSIELMEKNITTAGAATEQEDVNAGVETEDVESARADTIKAIDEAKGRIIESELKKLDGGQLAAKIVAEVPPESAGPLIDRLKQLGRIARLDIQRKQTTSDGATPAQNTRVEQKQTRLIISLYNLANVAPRETTNLNLACNDVEAVYRQIIARIEKAGGRVVNSALNRQKADQISGTINFEVKSSEAGPVLLDTRGLGEVMRLAVTENPDTANVTTAKQGFVMQLFSSAQIAPRETVTMQIAAKDVSQAYQSLVEIAKNQGRVLSSQSDEKDRQNVTGLIDLEIPRDKRDAIEKAIGSSGDVISRNATRSSDTENTIDSKLRIQISLIGADRVPPRESTLLGVQTSNVDSSVAKVTTAVNSAGGKVLDSTMSRESDGRSAARVLIDVPLGKAAQVIDQIKSLGEVRTERSTRNAQVPEGSLSRARIEVALATPQAIVSGETSLWGSIRSGLGTSFAGLMWSLQILVVGLCFVVPWGLVLWGAWKLARRARLARVSNP